MAKEKKKKESRMLANVDPNKSFMGLSAISQELSEQSDALNALVAQFSISEEHE